ncbi:MAG: sn-glycerol-1-phosphate dehydrogenase [Clostridiales bacterium]|nr:sn-glycerol-1-phosphate dehydrogenase [Clostridiales bacterium]
MTSFSSYPLEKLLIPQGFTCDCGKHHHCELKIFLSGAGKISQVPQVLSDLGWTYPYVVCDKNTYEAAGKKVEEILKKAGIDYCLHVIEKDKVEPDEWTVGDVVLHMDRACDGVMAVGSGVINDVCKVVSFAAGKEQMVVATAPSMDGYASTSSSMHVNQVKVTVYNHCPVAILSDTNIVAKAPMRMLWAGFGDMIAKYIALCEWRIAHLATEEYYCEEVAQLMRRSVKRITDNAGKLKDRDHEAIEAVMEGLVLSGVAMSFAKVSRPASGLEHYFSHMWEMMADERHTHADLHGIQVGIGTLLTLKLYDWMKTLTPDREMALKKVAEFDGKQWEKEMERIFGSATPQILALEKQVEKNDPKAHEKRLDRLVKGWGKVLGFMEEELPETEKIAALMKDIGMPMVPEDIGIDEQDAKDAFTGSREIRDKYLSSTMLWDLGLMEEGRERVRAK